MVELGTLNVAVKEPVAVVVIVAGEVVTVAPLNLIVTVDVPEKPVPVTVTVDPTVPLAGLRESVVFMVNVAEPESDWVSAAVTV